MAGGPVARAEFVGRVAKFPDGLVESADGMVDRADRTMIANETQGDVQIKAGREQAVRHDVVQILGDPVMIYGRAPDLRC
jgi:hypothetical protein